MKWCTFAMENSLIGFPRGFSYVCLPTCIYVHKCVPCPCGGHKRVLDSLELELEMTVTHYWELGTSDFSPGIATALKCGAISPASCLDGILQLNMHVPEDPFSYEIFFPQKK